jgi:phage protein D
MIEMDTYAPDYNVTINGRDLPVALRGCVTSVRYEDGVGTADRVEVGLANPDVRWLQEHIRGLGFAPFPTSLRIGPVEAGQFRPDGQFDLQNKLALSLGYAPWSLEEVFKGEVTGLQVTFPSGGMPTMTIVAHDYLHRLGEGSHGRGFGPLPDFLIAMILGAENLLLPLIDPTVVAASSAIAAVNLIFSGAGRKQKGQSNLELLKEIADTYDADFWVDGDTLWVSRFVKEYSPRLTLRWGESLIDFAPQVSTVGQVAGVAMKFTLREIPLAFLVSVGWDFDREAAMIRVLPCGVAPPSATGFDATFTIVDRAIASPADIATSALSIYHELRRRLNNRMTGRGTAIGDARIRAGAVIRLDGLGPDFSGDYRVANALHTVDGSGYRTTFEVRKEILP